MWKQWEKLVESLFKIITFQILILYYYDLNFFNHIELTVNLNAFKMPNN